MCFTREFQAGASRIENRFREKDPTVLQSYAPGCLHPFLFYCYLTKGLKQYAVVLRWAACQCWSNWFAFYYRPVVRTTANAAIKGRAAELSVSQFIRDRETVETELFKAVKRRLEGMFLYIKTLWGKNVLVCGLKWLYIKRSLIRHYDLLLFFEFEPLNAEGNWKNDCFAVLGLWVFAT